MNTIVNIKWDKPEEQAWLCDANIQLALENYCKNTKFKVKELEEMTGSEAIIGFCGWLASRDEEVTMSAKSNISFTHLIKEFCEVNKLTEPRNKWKNLCKTPK